jgi:hypothetical protein
VKPYVFFAALLAALVLALWQMERRAEGRGAGQPVVIAAAFAFAFGIACLNAWIGFSQPYIHGFDYLNGYHAAGRMVLEGRTQQFYARDTLGGWVNMPILSLLFVPFATLPRALAFAAFSALGLTCALMVIAYLARDMSPRRRVEMGLLFLINGPLFYSLSMGNTAGWLLLPLLGVFVYSASEGELEVGVLIGIAAAMKPFLLFLAVYLSMRRRFKAVAACGVTLGVLFGLSCLGFGLALNLEWWHFLGRFGSNPLSGYNNQAIGGVFLRLLQHPELFDYTPVAPAASVVVARILTATGVLGATAAVLFKVGPPQRPEAEKLELSIALCVAVLIAPLSWSYYHALLWLPLGFFVRGELGIPRTKPWLVALGVSTFLLSIPTLAGGSKTPWLDSLNRRLLVSHVFVGSIVMLGVLLLARLRVDVTGPRPRGAA